MSPVCSAATRGSPRSQRERFIGLARCAGRLQAAEDSLAGTAQAGEARQRR